MKHQGSESRQINPAMVTLARESRGLTQSEAAKLLVTTQTKLSRIEAGMASVDGDMLARLAEAFEYPVRFFTLTDPILGPGTSEFFHRRRQALSAKKLRQIHASLNVTIMNLARLLTAVDLPEDNIPRMDPEEYKSAAGVARAVRAHWSLPAGPIHNVVQVIEDAGGIVIPCDFGTPLMDALSRYVPGMPHLFFVNRTMPADRQRLTLAHELGHAIMHHMPYPSMEDEAYQFGAEFLMPANEIRAQFDRVDIAKLADMKPYWKVSMAALLYRARDVGKLSPRMERFLWMQMGKHGFRTHEPELGVVVEEPTTLKEIFAVHTDELGFGLEELSSLMVLSQAETRAKYNVEPTMRERKIRALIPRRSQQAM